MSRLIKKSRAIIIFAAIASIPLAASATAQQSNCANASSTTEMNVCADQNYQAADSALNDAYGAALEYVRAHRNARNFEDSLVRTERAWVAFRDADCKDLVPRKWDGGTATTTAILECMTARTLQRTKELKEEFRNP